MMISLGAAGVGAALHADARPRMEAQLRQDLNAAADDLADVLLEFRRRRSWPGPSIWPPRSKPNSTAA